MSSIRLSHPSRKIKTRIRVPASKSESNRVLILNALSGNKLQLENLSAARDTQTLIRLLADNGPIADVLDAGTAMRFLTAYYAATNQAKTITGTERMKQRPIAPLVNALSEMGFDIRYTEKEDFPPVEIHPVKLDRVDEEVYVEGNISSQFITALLLIAPFMPKGLHINFTTSLTSRSYIEMTLKILEHFGISYIWKDDSIQIWQATLKASHYAVGGDWSCASYWYTAAFLADEAEIFIEGLRNDWIQGDREVADWMKRFGISTEFTAEGALLKKVSNNYPTLMKLNFDSNPDLAQTFATMFAAKNVCCNFSGLDSLKIKETDRITALQTELAKMNVEFDYAPKYDFYQLKGAFQLPNTPIKTYNDHRMALSFAPLALLGTIEIEHPEVVEKSYPGFWKDMELAGFVVG
jgi:3-phosphoshikimate 1-carboxyvinyltransferase